jgi:glycosyltransferase involved in cell wall biosynthesis
MKIAINGSCLLNPTKTGVEWYVVSLLENMAKLPGQNEHEFFVYFPANGNLDQEWLEKFPENWHFKEVKWIWKYLWTQLALPRAIKKDKVDLLFVPAHVIPALYKGKAVMTVHDLAFKYFADSYSWKELKYQEWAVKSAAKKGVNFIVPSKTTYDDLARFYNIDKEKISLVYHGFAAQDFFAGDRQRAQDDSIRDKYKLAEKYFISVGRVENKKNTAAIIKAFDIFRQRYHRNDFSLVLVGKAGFGYENVVQAKNINHFSDDIKLLGYLPTEDLSALMKGAQGFLFPSLYEGFGFPILEAMSMDLPVITSNYGVMKEIAQENAVLIDPLDTEVFAKQMSEIISNQELRENLIQKGRERCQEFTWEKAARETLEAFTKMK